MPLRLAIKSLPNQNFCNRNLDLHYFEIDLSIEKGELFNLPFFPFVFSPFALFTGDEKAIETRQKAI